MTNVVLQRHCAKYIYAIPEGLRELMSDITREVLRSQPQEIYTFIADYLDALMITRENARVAAKTVQNIAEIGVTIVELLVQTGMSKKEAVGFSDTIQAAFKNYANEKESYKFQLELEPFEERDIVTEIIENAEISPQDLTATAEIIQKAFRLFKQHQDRDKDLLLGLIDWRVAARSTMRLYRRTDVTYEEANRASTLIKAAYKGYYTRRMMKRLLKKSAELSEQGQSAEDDKSPSFWEQYEEETLEEEKLGIVVDQELVADFSGKEETPQPIAVTPVDELIHEVLPNTTTISQAESVESEPQFLETEIIKPPIDDTQTDASTETQPGTTTDTLDISESETIAESN